jgi:hypothetical protein
MRKLFGLGALAAFAFAVMSTGAPAQTFEKKNYTYSEWTKGRFSEAVTLIGPGKMIFLAGVGAEDENGKGGDILHKGDFTAQCKYAFEKIKRQISARFRQMPAGHIRNDTDARPHAADHQPARLARHAGRGRRHCGGTAEVIAVAIAHHRAAAIYQPHRLDRGRMLD